MARRVLLGGLIALAATMLVLAGMHMLRPQRAEPTATIGNQPPQQSLPSVPFSEVVVQNASLSGETLDEALNVPSEAGQSTSQAQDSFLWKRYGSLEYGFEIAYPADWEFDSNYEDNNYGKLPSGHGRPAYAGETRNLFVMELDGSSQPQEGGGDFQDGAIIEVRITGASGSVEDWNISRDRPLHNVLVSSTPAEWVKLHSSPYGGDKVENARIATNGFSGAIQIACNGSNPCQIFGEAGGAYRTLPSGRVLLISWERAAGSNDFSYQKYLLPMLSSFRLLK